MKLFLYPRGGWTNQDVRDMEDNIQPERFQFTNVYVRVKYRSADDTSGWCKHPLEDQLKERNK